MSNATPVLLGDAVLSNGDLAVLAGNFYKTAVTIGGSPTTYYGFDQLQVAILSNSNPYTLNQTTGNLSFPSGDTPNRSVPGDAGVQGDATQGGGTIAALPGGGMAILTWGGSNLNYDLQILNNAGTVTTAPFVVHSQFSTAGNNAFYAANPIGAVAAWSGGLVVAYSTDDIQALFYQRYTVAGVAVGSAITVDPAGSSETNSNWSGTMAVDSQGDVIFGFGASDIYTPGSYKMYNSSGTLIGSGTVANSHSAPTFAPLSGGGFITVGYTPVGTYNVSGGYFPSFTMNIQTVSTAGAITTQDMVTHAVEDNYYQTANINWISVLPDGTVEFQEMRDNSYYHDANLADSYTVGGTLDRGSVTLPLPSDGNTPFSVLPATGPESNVVGVAVNSSNQLVAEGLSAAATPPSVTAGATVTFTGGGSALTADSGLTVTDSSSSNLVGATVSISSGYISGDTLNFSTQNGISGSYSSGTLTLTGTASAAAYQTALESITYSFTAGGDPTGGGGHTSRTLSWTVNDGTNSSTAATSTVNTVHAAPTISTSGTVTFTGGGSAATLDSGLTASDADSGGNLTGATVTISNFQSGDRLNFVNQGNITGTYNIATGVLTLSGTASIASYQAALRSVTYSFSPANGDPTVGGSHTSRTIDWTVTDGVGTSSTGTSTVTDVHAAPTITTGGTVTYASGGSAVVLDPTLTDADPDSGGNLTGASISISGLRTGDTLNFTTQNGISGNYNSSTGILTLTGTASIANYQTALASITYSSATADPTNGNTDTSRTIDWSVTDGVATSTTGTSTLDITPPHPVVTAGSTATFSGGGAPVAIDSVLTVSDAASTTLTGAVVTIGGFIAGDTLNFINQNNIIGIFNGGTGVLTLSGPDSLADYQAALRSITYSFDPTNGDPTAGGTDTNRTLTWTVTDGTNSSTAVTSTVGTTHVAPTVMAGATASFTGGGSPVALDSALTASDPDSGGNLTGATVLISAGFQAGDTLNFINQNNITGVYNAGIGVLTLSGSASLADYQTALQSITYSVSPSNGDPTNGGTDTSRTISWTVNDGTANSTAVTSTLNTTHVAPTVVAGATASFIGGGSPVVLDSALTASDPDSGGNLTGATVSISAGFQAGDTLNFVSQNGITGSYNAALGVLSLSGPASLADYQAALQSITYSVSPSNGDPTAGGTDTSRTISWTVNDGTASSTAVTSTLHTTHVAPTVVAGGTASFTGGGSPVALDSALTASDPDSGGNLTGATVLISAGFQAGDTLNFINQNNITGVYNAGIGVLTLSGSASLADYQTALQSITYSVSPSNGDPTNGGTDTSRTISWTVNDGTANSTAVTSTLNTTHVAPTVVAGATASFIGGGSPVVLDSALTASDPDSGGNLTGATVSISAGFQAGDTLNFVSQNGITGSYNAALGVLSLSGPASLADYQAALQSITYSVNPSNGDPTAGGTDTSRTISWTVNDGTASSTAVTSTLHTTHVAPTVDASGTVAYLVADTAAALDPALSVTDPDSGGMLTGAVISISGGTFASDGDALSADVTGTAISATYDAATETLTLSGTDTLADYQAVLRSITYASTSPDPTSGGDNATRTVSWSVSDGAAGSSLGSTAVTIAFRPPVISNPVAGQTTTDETTARPFSAVTITDPNLNQTETVTVTPSDATNGALSNLSGGSYNALTGVYTVTGSATAVTNALNGLVFTPTAHQVVPGATETTTFTIQVTAADGTTATDNSTTVIATAVNDPPVITGTQAGQTTTDEAAISPFAAVSISDIDFGQTETVTITLSNAANGTLSNLGDGSYDAETGIYTITGSDAAVTSAVDGLVFTPTAHQVAPAGSVTTGFTIQVTDTVTATSSDTTTTVVATAANDPPVIAGTVAGQTTTDEAAINPFTGVSISDVDAGQSETVTVTLSAAGNGMLSNLAGGSYNSSTGVYTVTGSDAAVTAAVDGLVFTPTAHQVTPGSVVATTFTIGVTDTAGASSSNSTTTVAATAESDPPVIAGTVAGQTTTDEAAINPFTGVSISDVDAGQTETVTITLSNHLNGTLSNVGAGSYNSSTGVYSVTGTDAGVTTAVDGLVFTPTAHQVAPGDTVTTTFTITATDTAGASASDANTTLAATAVNDPPSISLPAVNAGVPNETVATPFAGLTIIDPDVGHIDTVTVTLSEAAGGILSNLGSGSYDAETGVYTVVGSADAVTAALQGLIFTPAPPADGPVSTTNFTVSVTGPGGSASDSGISVTSVEQVLGLTGIPTGDDVVSISPDGSSFPPPVEGKTNEAVVSAPSDGATYTLPDGYQAEFLGGSASATLTDSSGGNALLFGNSGNDTITSSAANDTILGGAGQNVLSVSGTNDVIGASGVSTVNTSGANATVFGGTMALTATDTGTGDVLGLSTGTSNVTLGGSGATLYASTGPATVTDSGTDDAIGGYTGAISLTLNGTGTRVFGGSGTLSVDMTSLASGVAIGTGDGAAAITVGGGNASVYGGSGSLTVDVTGANALIGSGVGTATISISGSNTTVFGGTGALSVDVEAGATGALIGLGSGQASVTLAGTGSEIFGGSGSFTVNDVGSADTIAAGSGTTTIMESGSDGVVVGSSGNLLVTGGAGVATVFGGTGHATVNGGMGATTLFGSDGGDLTFRGSVGGATYQAGLGNETLDASLSTTANIINGGIDVTGRNSLVGGSGNDSIFAGTGADTFTGGGGNNEFVFYKTVIAGTAPTDVITDFNSNDIVILAGYGTTEAANALGGAVSSGGSTTITLSDNTRITFSNISNVSGLSGHVFST